MSKSAFGILKGASGGVLFRSQTCQKVKIEVFFLTSKKYFDNSRVILAVRSPTQLPEAIQSNFATL